MKAGLALLSSAGYNPCVPSFACSLLAAARSNHVSHVTCLHPSGGSLPITPASPECCVTLGAEEIVITGEQPDCVCTTKEQCILQSPDSSRMLRQLPGADVSSNGPLSGIELSRPGQSTGRHSD